MRISARLLCASNEIGVATPHRHADAEVRAIGEDMELSDHWECLVNSHCHSCLRLRARVVREALRHLRKSKPMILAPGHMDPTQWMLATLTAGVGGSMLSNGFSAAGVALMG